MISLWKMRNQRNVVRTSFQYSYLVPCFPQKLETLEGCKFWTQECGKWGTKGILVKVPHFLLLEGFNFWIQAYRKWGTKEILKVPKFNSSKLVPHFPHFTDLLTLTTSMKRMRHQWEKSTKSRNQRYFSDVFSSSISA